MFCFYKRVVGVHLIHTILPLVQFLQNMNCWKTDLNFASFISEYNPLVTIQAVMHEITADPAVFNNCTLGRNRWHNMNCQQIHLQVLTSQIKRWSGTPGTVVPKKEMFTKQKMVHVFTLYRRNKLYVGYWASVRPRWLDIKGQCHTIWQLYKKAKRCLRINWIPKIMIYFCY